MADETRTRSISCRLAKLAVTAGALAVLFLSGFRVVGDGPLASFCVNAFALFAMGTILAFSYWLHVRAVDRDAELGIRADADSDEGLTHEL